VFDRGRIVEEGDHGHLLARPDGTYRRLFERQVLALTPAASSLSCAASRGTAR
jgi:ATP-binding cassette, subfamily B, bacterial